MADEKTPAEEQAEALAADPIGGKPPIDIAQERALEDAEPLGYVDPKSQEVEEVPEVGTADAKSDEPAKKAAAPKSAVTREDAKGDS